MTSHHLTQVCTLTHIPACGSFIQVLGNRDEQITQTVNNGIQSVTVLFKEPQNFIYTALTDYALHIQTKM